MANKNRFKIQSLVFDRKYYKTKRQIKNWLSKNIEYKILNYKREPIFKKEFVYVVCQRESRYFKQSTFKNKNITKSGTIKAVIGKLK